MPGLSADALRAQLESFPRARLAHLPTPLQPLPRLSTALGGPEIWLKRDDCTGLATGGNKARKLEYLMGRALAEGATHVASFGALQSNHARQTAAAAAALGLGCDLFLVRRVACEEPAYESSGNLLLDDLLGARVHRVADEAEAASALAARLEALDARGERTFVIPTGGSSAVGALGYVGCAIELCEQSEASGFPLGRIYHATSSVGTQAGLAAGLAAMGRDCAPTGINVYARDVEGQRRELARLYTETMSLLGLTAEPLAGEIDHAFFGEDYGIPTAATLEAVAWLARYEGILLDPVYSGKAMGGLFAHIRSGALPADEPVVFIHTGGAAALFAYPQTLREGQAAIAPITSA